MRGLLKTAAAFLSGLVMALTGGGNPLIAEVRYPSFDGGGMEYSLTVEPEGVVAWTAERDYRDPDHEELDGAGYDMVFRFTGVATGSAHATVTGASPLMDEMTDDFWLTVDRDLNATLHRERPIRAFSLHCGGYMAPQFYDIWLDDDGSCLRRGWDEKTFSGDPALLDSLAVIVAQYGVEAWDGFHENDPNVLDGEGFTLSITFADGSTVYASGENAFPANYRLFVNACGALLGQDE